jgi:hypothetical protein
MKLKSVRIWIMILGLWSGVRMLTPAHAYEGDHYVWTYYLARHCGYTHRQAFQLASATYAIDFDPNTGPMPNGVTEWANIAAGKPTVHQRKWTEFHAFTLNQLKPGPAQIAKNLAAERRWKLADQQRNPGPFIHFMQDMSAHDGWDDVRGHGFAGHLPDFLSHDYPDQRRAKAMTVQTLKALKRFRSEVLGITEPVVVNPIIWTNLYPLVQANPLPTWINRPLSQENVLKDFYATRGLLLTPGIATALAAGGGGSVLALFEGLVVKEEILDVLLATPSLEKSLAAINRAIADEYQSGQLEKFPHRSFLDRDPSLIEQLQSSAVAPMLPEKWIHYIFDPDGREVQGVNYALENLQLHVEEPTVRVEPTVEQGLSLVKIAFLYRLTGVVPDIGSLPVVEFMEFSGSKGGSIYPGTHKNGSRLLYADQQTDVGRVGMAAFVPTEDCEQNRLVLTTGLQVAGLEPVWRRHKLVTAAPSTSVQGNVVKPGAAVWKLKDGWPKPNEHLDWHHKNTRNRIGGGKITFLPTEGVVLQWSYTEPPDQLVVGQTYRLSIQGLSTTHPGPPHPVSHVGIGADAKVMTSPLDGQGIHRERNMSHGVIPPPLRPDYGNNPTADSIDFVFQPDSSSKSFRVWVALPVAGIPLLIYEYEPFKPAPTAGGDPTPPPSGAPGYKLQRMPDPVFAASAVASAPKTAVTPVPPPVSGPPKEVPPPNKSVSDLLGKELGTSSGIRAGKLVLIEVEGGSPGDNMGLGSGDRILRIGDKSLDGLMAAELQALAHAPLRAPLEIELLRGRDQARVVVTLIERAPADYTMTVTVVPGTPQ